MAAGCGCELEDVETWGCGAGALGRRSLPQSFADTHTVLRTLDSSPKTGPCNSILDFMRDKNEVQTFLCSRRFYAAIGIPI